MSKVFKNIAIFSLWMAGLVIIAHLLVPHDHHSESSVFNKESECHASNTKLPAKAPAFPVHCHTLNDLTFKNTPVTIIVCNDIPACDLFILSFFDTAIPDPGLPSVITKDFHDPLITIDYLRLSPFRAPPALV